MGWLSSGVYTESKAELCRHIHATWDQIQSRAQTIPVALPKSLTLLGSSTKIKLTSEAFPEVLTRVIYMSPDSEAFQPESSRTMCPFASAECSAACLGHNSGLLAMDDQKQARIWKTALYVGARELWRALLRFELAAFSRYCESRGLQGAVRIDGSSDTGESLKHARDFGSLTFYDYHKVPTRSSDLVRLCYSFDGSEQSREHAREVLQAGGNVAVVFDARPKSRSRAADQLPATWEGFPVFDGDVHDFLPADPYGQVRGLHFKAARDRSGSLELAGSFVEPVEVST
mgnify:FL=1